MTGFCSHRRSVWLDFFVLCVFVGRRMFRRCSGMASVAWSLALMAGRSPFRSAAVLALVFVLVIVSVSISVSVSVSVCVSVIVDVRVSVRVLYVCVLVFLCVLFRYVFSLSLS